MGINIEKLKEIAVPRSKEAIQSARERKLKRLMKKKFLTIAKEAIDNLI